jgi:hypothetical protein
MSRLAAGERFADAPAELFMIPPHDTLRSVKKRARLLLRRWCARRESTLSITIRELKNPPGKLLYLALALTCLGVLVGRMGPM